MTKTLLRPVAALAFGSMAGCVLLAVRSLALGQGRHLHLVWNLFLAWLPLLFAIALEAWSRSSKVRRGVGWGLGGAWLLFFPNAPYLLTDLVHLGTKAKPHYWTDLVVILVFALTGLVLGFVALFIVQRVVSRRFGWAAGWAFVCGIAFLNGFGVYAGRFLRWNSWDVVFSPVTVLVGGLEWFASIPQSPRGFLLPVLFAFLMFLSYVMLYGLTQLRLREERPELGISG